ncbi:MAG TPA: hypothetical protein VFB38_26000 [Chthonomonadaceae bacterium]|nr:hypothetical protein [Chthonomonadaceae bacterium]
MWQRSEHDPTGEELFLAGEKVRPGIYRQVGGGREVHLEQEDFLPASLDGRVACYKRVKNTWAQILERTPA